MQVPILLVEDEGTVHLVVDAGSLEDLDFAALGGYYEEPAVWGEGEGSDGSFEVEMGDDNTFGEVDEEGEAVNVDGYHGFPIWRQLYSIDIGSVLERKRL